MRALTATLAAAQKSPVREEVVRCLIADAPIEWPRWSWSPIYGPTETDGPHGIAQLQNGHLLRARQTTGGAVYTQRIVDPAQPSQWSSWTLWKAAATTDPAAGIALTASTTENRARLFYLDVADSRTIRCAESTDGLTWLEEVAYVEPHPRLVRALAADMTAADNHLVYACDLQTGDPDVVLVAIERTAPATWVNRVQHAEQRYPVRGLCAARDPAAGLIYVGVCDGLADGARRIAFQELDVAANVWGSGAVLTTVAAGAGFDLLAPFLRVATAAFPRHVYTFVEQSTGSPASARPMLAVTPQRYWLTEWVPWDVESVYGFAPLRTAAGWYLSGATRAYSSPLESGGVGQLVDVAADVASIEATEPGPNRPATLTLLLDNAGGAYSLAGQPGAKLALREGSQVALGLGCRTSAGAESVWTVPWWIERVGYQDERGAGYLRLECVDAWSYLERLRAPRQVVFAANSTIADILNRLLWRVTGATLAATGALATTVPGFTVQPGESYASAVRRLGRLAGAIVRFDTDQSAPNGVGLTSVVADAVPFASGAALYSYAAAAVGGAAHPIERGRYLAGGQAFSHVEVFGLGGLVGDSFDHLAIRRLWKNVPRKVVDRSMDSQSKVDALVGYELTAVQTGAVGGYLEAGANVGLGIGDVVDVTDPRAGLSAAKRTVVGLRTVYDRRTALRLTQRVLLAGAT